MLRALSLHPTNFLRSDLLKLTNTNSKNTFTRYFHYPHRKVPISNNKFNNIHQLLSSHTNHIRFLTDNNNNKTPIEENNPQESTQSSILFAKLHQKYKDVIPPRKVVLHASTPHIPSSVTDSQRAVWIAILGNSIVTATKFVAHFATGSSTMLSEAIHSFADTLNQCLLAIGIARAKKPASVDYPYGHAREAYVWALVSAVGIFFLGAGVTIREGIQRLGLDEKVEHFEWCAVALAISFVIEGISLLTALVAIRRAALSQGMKMWSYIYRGSDPLAVAVLLEDSAALLGVLIAGTSLALCQITGEHVWDAIGSLAIGVLLGFVALFLIRKNRDLLVGQGVSREQRLKFINFIMSDPVVHSMSDVKAEMIGVGVLRFKAEINFNGQAVTKRRLQKMDTNKIFRENCQTPQQLEEFLIKFGDEVIDQLGEEVDRLETNIIHEFPEVIHVDLEAD